MRSLLFRPHLVIVGIVAAGLLLAGLIGFGVVSTGLVGCASSGMLPSKPGVKPAVPHEEASAPQAEAPSGLQFGPHSYFGTASAGDFLSITVTPTSAEGGTIRYSDLSNGEQGDAIPYMVHADGTYAIEDPDGNLATAVEAPGYGLVLQMKRTGAEHATEALVTAMESAPATAETLAGAYNYMQFRPDHGGVEVGSARISVSEIAFSGYSPYRRSVGQAEGLRRDSLPVSSLRKSSDGRYMTLAIEHEFEDPDTEYLSGAANGGFLLDTPQGSVIGLPQSASSAFDAANAGTYGGIYYQKSDVQGTASGAEFGIPTVDPVTVKVSASGAVALADSETGSVLAAGTLAPACGAGAKLNGSCNGLFVLRLRSNGAEQEVYVAFARGRGRGTILFSSFWPLAGQGAGRATGPSGEKYSYFYGVGLKRA